VSRRKTFSLLLDRLVNSLYGSENSMLSEIGGV